MHDDDEPTTETLRLQQSELETAERGPTPRHDARPGRTDTGPEAPPPGRARDGRARARRAGDDAARGAPGPAPRRQGRLPALQARRAGPAPRRGVKGRPFAWRNHA